MNIKTEFSKRGEEPELLRFLNTAFGYDPEKNEFLDLLPKLYREEYDPCQHNLTIRGNGKIVAAAGVYPTPLRVLGEPLSCVGIGNVAVDASVRGKGLMTALMREVTAFVSRSGFDLAVLGGQRQRYETFGFYLGGCEHEFVFKAANLKHAFGDRPCSLCARQLEEGDAAIGEVIALHDAQPYRALRRPERFFDILRSWKYAPYTLWKGDDFAGYFLRKDNDVRELLLRDPNDFGDAICAMKGDADLTVALHPYERDLLLRAAAFSETETLTQWEKFCVLRWMPVLSAALRLHAATTPLDNGTFTVRIGAEPPVVLSVNGGVASVCLAKAGESPELTLDRAQAMAFFFGRESAHRAFLPSPTRWWFPFPLALRMADHV